jgi:hypothetical protein
VNMMPSYKPLDCHNLVICNKKAVPIIEPTSLPQSGAPLLSWLISPNSMGYATYYYSNCVNLKQHFGWE